MKTSILISALALVASVATPAMAISRYDSEAMSCRETQATVRAEGVVLLQHGSKRQPGMRLYDRFVRNGQYCQSNEIAVTGYVPTADRASCPVRKCEPASQHFEDDRDLFIPR